MAKRCIEVCRSIKYSPEARVIINQMLRSASSTPADIAEGFAGFKGSSYRNYLVIARRSCSETSNWILLAFESALINEEVYLELSRRTKEINNLLTKIIILIRLLKQPLIQVLSHLSNYRDLSIVRDFSILSDFSVILIPCST